MRNFKIFLIKFLYSVDFKDVKFFLSVNGFEDARLFYFYFIFTFNVHSKLSCNFFLCVFPTKAYRLRNKCKYFYLSLIRMYCPCTFSLLFIIQKYNF